MPARIVVDDEIALVSLQRGAAPACAALIAANRPRLARWLPWAATSNGAGDVAAFIATVEERRARGGGDAFAIELHGALAGAVDLHDVDRERGVARIGYWLGEAFGGRGVMTRAVRALTAHAHGEEGLRRVEIVAAEENRASRAVAERAGFAFETLLPEPIPTGLGFEPAVLYAHVGGARSSGGPPVAP
jgi:ribosomal-protein-serine acetyltransferase